MDKTVEDSTKCNKGSIIRTKLKKKWLKGDPNRNNGDKKMSEGEIYSSIYNKKTALLGLKFIPK